MTSDSDDRIGRELAHLRELNQQIEALERADNFGEEHERLGRERAAEVVRLEEEELWHPVSLAAELKIGVGLLAGWATWE